MFALTECGPSLRCPTLLGAFLPMAFQISSPPDDKETTALQEAIRAAQTHWYRLAKEWAYPQMPFYPRLSPPSPPMGCFDRKLKAKNGAFNFPPHQKEQTGALFLHTYV